MILHVRDFDIKQIFDWKIQASIFDRFLIDFWSILKPFLEPKSLENRFQSGFRTALGEDSVSKLQIGGGTRSELEQEQF